MGKYRHNANGSTKLVQNFLLRGICASRTLIVQVLIGAMRGLVVSILVIRNFALTEFTLARLHCMCIYDMIVDPQKLNLTLAIDLPFQAFAVELLQIYRQIITLNTPETLSSLNKSKDFHILCTPCSICLKDDTNRVA